METDLAIATRKLSDLPSEDRLRLLEDKVGFLMSVVSVPAQLSALDPAPRLISALQAYLLLKAAQIQQSRDKLVPVEAS